MDIALLNVRITFQKGTVATDAIGNRTNGWEDYYSCHATVSGEGGSEKAVAGQTVEDTDLAFTVRYCKKATAVTTDGFRILFDGSIYNILSIDHMSFKRKTLKFRCQKVRW